jgi:carboxyl-terminal processing protease
VKGHIRAAAALLGLALGSVLAVCATDWRAARFQDTAFATPAAAPGRELEAFHAAFAQIKARYPEQPNDAKLIGWAISGLIKQLDTNSAFLDAQSFRDAKEEARGVFGGLGIEVTEAEGLVKVVAPAAGSHAEKAGIRPGDLITQLDHASIRGLSIKQVVEKMRGPVRSRILLRVRRPGLDQPLDLSIERELIRVRSVGAWPEGDDVGYIRLTKFNGLTFQGVRTALHELASKIPVHKLKGYVLDLRNNPGGLLDQAVLVASVFLRGGEIVSTRGRNTSDVYRLEANAAPRELIDDKPVIVLIDGGTASAAEIVAGALQDHKRATLVGTRSFGKGSVQTLTSLGPGNGGLKLTTAWYFTPAGRTIQTTGILPDIEVLQEAPQPASAGIKPADESPQRQGILLAGAKARGELHSFPPDQTNDQALNLALELLRGTKVNAAFPPKTQAGK